MRVSGWGRYPVIDTTIAMPRTEEALADLLAQGQTIGRGNGRSYGDSALNQEQIISLLGFNLMESFDEDTGLLVAGAGVMLAEIIDTY